VAAPVVTSTQVVAAFDNGQMLAFDVTDGSSLWEIRVAQPTGRHDLERIVDIDGTPLQQGGFLYVASYQGVIAAIARAQGRIAWKQDISSYQPLVYANRKIFATTANGKVIAYNSNTGAEEWENSFMLRRSVGAPAIIGDYVVVIDGEGYMHLLDQNDGTFVGRLSAKGKRFRSPMLSHEDKLYVLSGDGKLTAYRLANK
jgi:outer membrane protein assembly factor BamB